MNARATPDFPLATFIGMVTGVTGPGSATARIQVSPEQLNPHGSVHGAVLVAMVDTAMGAATLSVLDEHQRCASIDVQMRFCTAVFGGELVATASVVRAGKRIVHLSAEVRDGGGETVAFGSGSFAVITASGEV